MEKKIYNNVFNQGIEAAANSLDHFRQVAKEGETLTNERNVFNQLVDSFQKHIREQTK